MGAKRVVLVGGGGHASDILAAYEAISRLTDKRHAVIGILDDGDIDERRFRGRGVGQIGSVGDLRHIDATHYVLALGWPKMREAVSQRVRGLPADIVIHPTADVPPGIPVGEGSVILAHAHVSITAEIGSHVYLSHAAIVTHDCIVEDFVSVMPGASVSGAARLERGCMVGANAAVIEGRRIGAGAMIGAGAVVINDVPPGAIAAGVPARWRLKLASPDQRDQ